MADTVLPVNGLVDGELGNFELLALMSVEVKQYLGFQPLAIYDPVTLL